MAKKKKLTPEEEMAERGREAVASLFRTVALETLPWMTRTIIENDLKKMPFPQLLQVIDEFKNKVFASLLAHSPNYLDELYTLMEGQLASELELGRFYIGFEKLKFVTAATEVHFFEAAKDDKEEQKRRTTFLALLHCTHCLMRLEKYTEKQLLDGVALETLLFCLSAFQATHASIVVEAVRVKGAQEKKPKHFAHRQTMTRILAQLLQKRDKFRSKEAGCIFHAEYPHGVTADNIKFSYYPATDELLYEKPDGSKGTWGLKDFQDMMAEAKKTPKN